MDASGPSSSTSPSRACSDEETCLGECVSVAAVPPYVASPEMSHGHVCQERGDRRAPERSSHDLSTPATQQQWQQQQPHETPSSRTPSPVSHLAPSSGVRGAVASNPTPPPPPLRFIASVSPRSSSTSQPAAANLPATRSHSSTNRDREAMAPSSVTTASTVTADTNTAAVMTLMSRRGTGITGTYKSVPVLPPQVFRSGPAAASTASTATNPTATAAAPQPGLNSPPLSSSPAASIRPTMPATTTSGTIGATGTASGSHLSANPTVTTSLTFPLSATGGGGSGGAAVRSSSSNLSSSGAAHLAGRPLAFSIGGSRRRNSVTVPTNTFYLEDDDNVNTCANDESCLSTEPQWLLESSQQQQPYATGSGANRTSRSSSREPPSEPLAPSAAAATASVSSPPCPPTSAWSFVRPQAIICQTPRDAGMQCAPGNEGSAGPIVSLMSPKSPLSLMSGHSAAASGASAIIPTVVAAAGGASPPLPPPQVPLHGTAERARTSPGNLYKSYPPPPITHPHFCGGPSACSDNNRADTPTQATASPQLSTQQPRLQSPHASRVVHSRDHSLALSFHSPLQSPPMPASSSAFTNTGRTALSSRGTAAAGGGGGMSRRDSLNSSRHGAHDPYNAAVITPSLITAVGSPASSSAVTLTSPTTAGPSLNALLTATVLSGTYELESTSIATSAEVSYGAQEPATVSLSAKEYRAPSDHFLGSAQSGFHGGVGATGCTGCTTEPYQPPAVSTQQQQPPASVMPALTSPLGRSTGGGNNAGFHSPFTHQSQASASLTSPTPLQLPPQQQQLPQSHPRYAPQQHHAEGSGEDGAQRPMARRRTAQEALTGFFSETPIELGDQTHLVLDRNGNSYHGAPAASMDTAAVGGSSASRSGAAYLAQRRTGGPRNSYQATPQPLPLPPQQQPFHPSSACADPAAPSVHYDPLPQQQQQPPLFTGPSSAQQTRAPHRIPTVGHSHQADTNARRTSTNTQLYPRSNAYVSRMSTGVPPALSGGMSYARGNDIGGESLPYPQQQQLYGTEVFGQTQNMGPFNRARTSIGGGADNNVSDTSLNPNTFSSWVPSAQQQQAVSYGYAGDNTSILPEMSSADAFPGGKVDHEAPFVAPLPRSMVDTGGVYPSPSYLQGGSNSRDGIGGRAPAHASRFGFYPPQQQSYSGESAFADGSSDALPYQHPRRSV